MSKHKSNSIKINPYINIIILICILSIGGLFIYILSKKFVQVKEGLTTKSTAWSSDTIANFPNAWVKYSLAAQKTTTPPGTMTIAQLQSQVEGLYPIIRQFGVTDSEADAYIKNGTWNYSANEIKALSAANAQYITPKPTSKQISDYVNMSQIQYPFVLPQWRSSGASFQQLNTSKTQCTIDGHMTDPTGNTKILPAQIPKLIPGFKFINSPCDPCVLYDQSNNTMSQNFNCPFSVSDASINPILEYSWGIGPYSKTAMPSISSIPSMPSASSFSFGNSGDASGNSVPSSNSLGDRIKGAVTSIMNIF